MPTINAAQPAAVPGEVHAAIARASAATGVDFDYLLAEARLESGLDTEARAPTSSAAGLYQFVSGTWLGTVDRHGADHGLGWAGAAITKAGGRAQVSDPALREAILALRHDADASALMAAELARDNGAELRPVLGRDPDAAELYLAHFLGSGGAKQFLSALQANPGQSAAALFPQAAGANRAIFRSPAGDRSVGEVMELIRGKVAAAMNGSSSSTTAPVTTAAAFRFAAASHARSAAPDDMPGARPSMSETLRATFGSDGLAAPGSALARVDAAYGKLKAFNL